MTKFERVYIFTVCLVSLGCWIFGYGVGKTQQPNVRSTGQAVLIANGTAVYSELENGIIEVNINGWGLTELLIDTNARTVTINLEECKITRIPDSHKKWHVKCKSPTERKLEE